VGYISSYVDKTNKYDVFFVLSTVHPDWTTLAHGKLSPTSRPAVFPEDGRAQTAAIGFVSGEAEWLFFSNGGWGITWLDIPPSVSPQHGALHIDHIERLVLTILEGVAPFDSNVFGYLNNPNWKHEIPIRKLTVQDHPNGLVLYGLDGNGAAIGITLQAIRNYEKP
jgi:hypothetical protein